MYFFRWRLFVLRRETPSSVLFIDLTIRSHPLTCWSTALPTSSIVPTRHPTCNVCISISPKLRSFYLCAGHVTSNCQQNNDPLESPLAHSPPFPCALGCTASPWSPSPTTGMTLFPLKCILPEKPFQVRFQRWLLFRKFVAGWIEMIAGIIPKVSLY